MASLSETLFVCLSLVASVALACPDQMSYAQASLAAHNLARAEHGSPPLRLAADLNSQSEAYAKILASQCTLKHDNTNLGENLFYVDRPSQAEECRAKLAVDSWVSERNGFDYSAPQGNHFTQVVWKASRELGVGAATSACGTFVVARYRPAGNFLNQFSANVRPKGSKGMMGTMTGMMGGGGGMPSSGMGMGSRPSTMGLGGSGGATAPARKTTTTTTTTTLTGTDNEKLLAQLLELLNNQGGGVTTTTTNVGGGTGGGGAFTTGNTGGGIDLSSFSVQPNTGGNGGSSTTSFFTIVETTNPGTRRFRRRRN